MRVLKTFLVVACLTSSMPAQAEPLTHIFATCTGRFSAELEHAWLMGHPETDSIAHRRAQFEDLLYAVATDGEHRDLLNRRINAKQAHAQILQQATFSTDSAQADWARRRVNMEIGYCASFLLES